MILTFDNSLNGKEFDSKAGDFCEDVANGAVILVEKDDTQKHDPVFACFVPND